MNIKHFSWHGSKFILIHEWMFFKRTCWRNLLQKSRRWSFERVRKTDFLDVVHIVLFNWNGMGILIWIWFCFGFWEKKKKLCWSREACLVDVSPCPAFDARTLFSDRCAIVPGWGLAWFSTFQPATTQEIILFTIIAVIRPLKRYIRVLIFLLYRLEVNTRFFYINVRTIEIFASLHRCL